MSSRQNRKGCYRLVNNGFMAKGGQGLDRIDSGKSEVGTNTSSWGEKEGCCKEHGV